MSKSWVARVVFMSGQEEWWEIFVEYPREGGDVTEAAEILLARVEAENLRVREFALYPLTRTIAR